MSKKKIELSEEARKTLRELEKQALKKMRDPKRARQLKVLLAKR
jgi:hypothetical protein